MARAAGAGAARGRAGGVTSVPAGVVVAEQPLGQERWRGRGRWRGSSGGCGGSGDGLVDGALSGCRWRS